MLIGVAVGRLGTNKEGIAGLRLLVECRRHQTTTLPGLICFQMRVFRTRRGHRCHWHRPRFRPVADALIGESVCDGGL